MEKKKNIIIEGFFTKIIYFDQFVTLNAIYIQFLIHSQEKIINNYIFFNPLNNMALIKKIAQIEEEIANYFREEFNITKPIVLALYNQLYSGKIKVFTQLNNSIGPAYDFSTKSEGVYLRNVRVNSEDDVRSRKSFDEGMTNRYNQGNRKTPQRVANDSTRGSQGLSWDKPRLPNDSAVPSGASIVLPNYRENNSRLVLKISGIWENHREVGIAYKFLEMFYV